MYVYHCQPWLFGITVLVFLTLTPFKLSAEPALARALSLHEAVEAAWARNPAARASAARREELTARRKAANGLFPAPPSVSFSHRSDQPYNGQGQREYEAELSLPLWMPGARKTTRATAQAELGRFDAKLVLAKLKLAGEVRDAYWQVRLAANERDLAHRRADEAIVLAGDVARRVKSGDLARASLNQARGLEHQARATALAAEARATRALRLFTVLTGFTRLPDKAEEEAARVYLLEAHPLLNAHRRTLEAARAKLKQTTTIKRDHPELILGAGRSRDDTRDPYGDTVHVGVRFPLSTQARNRPLIAAASADLEEAEATLAQETDRVAAEIDAVRAGLELAKQVEQLASERLRLAIDTHKLYAKAFRLGEVDLQTRLRAENERFDAELALTRARLDAGRAIASLNQSYGLVP